MVMVSVSSHIVSPPSYFSFLLNSPIAASQWQSYAIRLSTRSNVSSVSLPCLNLQTKRVGERTIFSFESIKTIKERKNRKNIHSLNRTAEIRSSKNIIIKTSRAQILSYSPLLLQLQTRRNERRGEIFSPKKPNIDDYLLVAKNATF